MLKTGATSLAGVDTAVVLRPRRGVSLALLAFVIAAAATVAWLSLNPLSRSSQWPASPLASDHPGSPWVAAQARTARAQTLVDAASPDVGEARFDARGVQVPTASGTLSLDTVAIGDGATIIPLRQVAPRASHGAVTYDRGLVSEWYRESALGLEQGFDVPERPAGASGALTIVLGTSGPLADRLGGAQVVFLSRSGRVSLRYTGLAASDALGRRLPVGITVRGRTLLLHVDVRGARYPVRIDPYLEQPPKLVVGSNEAAGWDVALSADGDTALIGAPYDGGYRGAASVFVRSGDSWVQQGPALTPSSATPLPSDLFFGAHVALSADGNTALVTGSSTASDAWVFVRSGATWSQQGPPLVPSDAVGVGDFGSSIGLSSDGNTVLVGGSNDNNGAGAAWVFGRTGSSWAQQGSKLTLVDPASAGGLGADVAVSGDGATALVAGYKTAAVFTRTGTTWSLQTTLSRGTAVGSDDAQGLGLSAALSADGNTALLGAPQDNASSGAAWVFNRFGSSWSAATELTAPDLADDPNAESDALFGTAVALSADGNTALIGEPHYGGGTAFAGGAFDFERAGSSWTASGRIEPGDAVGAPQFGDSVALSSDGVSALIGGPYDDQQETGSDPGAAFSFVLQTGSTTVAPTVTVQPQNETVTAPAGASFDAAASGVPTPSVQWEFSVDGGQTWSDVDGATSTTLSIEPTSDAQTGQMFRAVFTNTAGIAVTNPTTLTVLPPVLPTVARVTPDVGRAWTFVVIRGTHLIAAREVDFGPGHAAPFVALSDSLIVSVAPPEPRGTVDVTVRDASGMSATNAHDRFTYEARYGRFGRVAGRRR